MITADEACKIADAKVTDELSSLLFKYAIDQIERYVRDAAKCGRKSFSYNIDALAPGYNKPSLHMRKAIAEELKKNRYSYSETQRSPSCVWFEVSR